VANWDLSWRAPRRVGLAHLLHGCRPCRTQAAPEDAPGFGRDQRLCRHAPSTSVTTARRGGGSRRGMQFARTPLARRSRRSGEEATGTLGSFVLAFTTLSYAISLHLGQAPRIFSTRWSTASEPCSVRGHCGDRLRDLGHPGQSPAVLRLRTTDLVAHRILVGLGIGLGMFVLTVSPRPVLPPRPVSRASLRKPGAETRRCLCGERRRDRSLRADHRGVDVSAVSVTRCSPPTGLDGDHRDRRRLRPCTRPSFRHFPSWPRSYRLAYLRSRVDSVYRG